MADDDVLREGLEDLVSAITDGLAGVERSLADAVSGGLDEIQKDWGGWLAEVHGGPQGRGLPAYLADAIVGGLTSHPVMLPAGSKLVIVERYATTTVPAIALRIIDEPGRTVTEVCTEHGVWQRLGQDPKVGIFALPGHDGYGTVRLMLGGTNVPSSRVYFIGSGDGKIIDKVKIGRSSTPAKRRANMQVGSPAKLTLLGTMPGGAAEEKATHELFKHLRLEGEWFTNSPELQAWIAANCTVEPGETA